ncbi:hypothetical protein NM688_g5232 [Phlebia brevispora]|uniref:Uncharacterized protein n=1 Tax=Phlebia brevispora TaxID=194682 RepID=A0ACC1SYL6_9APHY|nr:hypothetical protein NM688_g5232 [Phlebia brevispora]
MSDTEDKHIDKKPRLASPPRPINDVEEAYVQAILKEKQPEESYEPEDIEPIADASEIPTAPGPAPDLGGSMLGALTNVLFSHLQMPKAPRKYKLKTKPPEPFSKEDIIWREVLSLLGQETIDKAKAEGKEWEAPYEKYQEVELVVSCLSAHGDSLSIAPTSHPWVVVTPHALPGERIRVRIYQHSYLFSYADLLEIVEPNPKYRDDSRVKCKYFGQCSGCQYQMLDYETQLQLKRDIIVKAYNNYSNLPPSSVPTIGPTLSSPLQYGYRTKLTPHFAMGAGRAEINKETGPANGAQPEWLKIGFNKIGKRNVLDIEECPIATPAVNEGFTALRQEVINKVHTYKRGVSLLLRESLDVKLTPSTAKARPDKPPRWTIAQERNEWIEDEDKDEKRLCVTDHNQIVRERVGDTKFEYNAGSFFQNNNSRTRRKALNRRTSSMPTVAAACSPSH